MFYQLLVEQSRDYSKYEFKKGILQFVEPDRSGQLQLLEAIFSPDEMAEFKKLICAVWHCITTLELPPVDEFEPNYKGVLAFEQHLIDKYCEKS